MNEKADQFALCLLMPSHMVYHYCRKYNLGMKDLVSLSKIFGVPWSKMGKRLRQLQIN